MQKAFLLCKKNIYAAFFLAVLSAFFLLIPQKTYSAFELIRSSKSSTVYYVDSQGIRHAFPNFTTYKSWYGSDFSKVMILSDDFVQSFPLGDNVTIKPGKQLVKIPSDSKVYAVEQGGTTTWHIISLSKFYEESKNIMAA